VMGGRRWDSDTSGISVADGRPFLPPLETLASTMAEDGWIAEEPAVHLLPHIRRRCDEIGRFRILVEGAQEDGVYLVRLEWQPGHDSSKRSLRDDVFALIGSFAESATHVHERDLPGAFEFDVTTGLLPEQTHLHSHGHLVGLRVERAAG
jgi:hypothetical protein